MLFEHLGAGCQPKKQPRANKAPNARRSNPVVKSTNLNFELEMIHWNVRSIKSVNKMANVMEFIKSVSSDKPGFVSLVETHLDRKVYMKQDRTF